MRGLCWILSRNSQARIINYASREIENFYSVKWWLTEVEQIIKIGNTRIDLEHRWLVAVLMYAVNWENKREECRSHWLLHLPEKYLSENREMQQKWSPWVSRKIIYKEDGARLICNYEDDEEQSCPLCLQTYIGGSKKWLKSIITRQMYGRTRWKDSMIDVAYLHLRRISVRHSCNERPGLGSKLVLSGIGCDGKKAASLWI